MQPDASHQAVDDKGDASEEAKVFEQCDEDKEQRDLRYKNNNVTTAGDEAVDYEI